MAIPRLESLFGKGKIKKEEEWIIPVDSCQNA